MSERPIQVLLMDDHNVVREGLRALLERQTDIRRASPRRASVAEAEAARGRRRTWSSPTSCCPDERGAEVVRRLRERFPRAAILVLTMVDNPTDVQLCLAAGAQGVPDEGGRRRRADGRRARGRWRRGVPAAGARRGARAVARGAREGQRAGDRSTSPSASARCCASSRSVTRTPRSRRLLFLSVRTVENHRASLMRKLGVRTRPTWSGTRPSPAWSDAPATRPAAQPASAAPRLPRPRTVTRVRVVAGSARRVSASARSPRACGRSPTWPAEGVFSSLGDAGSPARACSTCSRGRAPSGSRRSRAGPPRPSSSSGTAAATGDDPREPRAHAPGGPRRVVVGVGRARVSHER